MARARRVHGPLLVEVGLVPPQPEGRAGERDSAAVSERCQDVPVRLSRGLSTSPGTLHAAMDDIFRAWAAPGRRRLLASLNAHNGQTLTALCAGMDMTRQSVTKHLEI